ncbi:MAG TPA: hypothetical protein VK155_19775 [Bacteroidales bacterium]|jgi:hypothetical protein|nr:hypothetical protein [Bacteroidales bacterium]
METKKALVHIFGTKILAVILLFFAGSALTSGQKKMSFLTDSKYETEWWFPLIKKHNIDPNQFTFGGNLKPDASEPDEYTALELGGAAFINNKVVTINDAAFFIKEQGDTYNLITAKSASHDLVDGKIRFESGKIEEYKFKSSELSPVRSSSFTRLQMDPATKEVVIVAVSPIQK